MKLYTFNLCDGVLWKWGGRGNNLSSFKFVLMCFRAVFVLPLIWQ